MLHMKVFKRVMWNPKQFLFVREQVKMVKKPFKANKNKKKKPKSLTVFILQYIHYTSNIILTIKLLVRSHFKP